MNPDDCEAEEGFDPFENYVILRPLSKFTAFRFATALTLGMLRAVLSAVDQLDDALIGAQGYEAEKKSFEDGARIDLEMITSGQVAYEQAEYFDEEDE